MGRRCRARPGRGRLLRLARSHLVCRRMHPPHPPVRRPADHRPTHRRTAALGVHPRHARPGDLQSLRQPPHRGLPVLRRNLPPRRLPAHPLRPDRRQRRPRNRRHPPSRLRHLHRPLLRHRPHPRHPPRTPAPTGPAAPAAPNPATPAATAAPASTAARTSASPVTAPADPKLGQPLCMDCYDYAAHAVWNNAAGELWRRTKQAIERYLASLARHRRVPSSPDPPRQRQIPPRPTGPGLARQGRRIPGPRSRPLPRPPAPGRHRPQRPGRGRPATGRNHRRRPGRRHPVRGTRHPVHHPTPPHPARRMAHPMG